MTRESAFAGRVCANSEAAQLDAARGAVDALLWRRDIRAAAASVARDSALRGARASAAIDGADVPVADDSPMGRVLAGAEAVNEAVPALVEVWRRAPIQALVALHARAVVGLAPAEEIGRPRATDTAQDPLHIGALPEAAAVAPRLQDLARALSTPAQAPALFVAAVTHAELMLVQPFLVGSGIVARAAVRLVLADRGVDPSLFSIPEVGMADLGRPAYVRAVRAYAQGSAAGLGEYCGWFAEVIRRGAESVRISEDG